jgi:hypothetical protein
LAAHRSLTTTSIDFFKELLSPLESSLREVEVAAFVKLSLIGFFRNFQPRHTKKKEDQGTP